MQCKTGAVELPWENHVGRACSKRGLPEVADGGLGFGPRGPLESVRAFDQCSGALAQAGPQPHFFQPPGTPATKVLQAVRRFATNEWALKHRYAMVLHTNEPHPHVHVVVKAMSEQGKRLNIRKPTLRAWRTQFAESARTRRCCECDGARRSGSIRDLPARCGLPREGGSQTRIDLPA